MEKRVLDSFTVSGKDINEFNTELKNLAKITSVKEVNSKDISIVSKREDIEDDGEFNVYWVQPDATFSYAKDGTPFIQCKTIKESVMAPAPEMVKEYQNNTKTMLLIGKELYFVSDNLWNTLGMRSGVAGPQMYIPSVERDLLVARGLNNDNTYKAVIRTENDRSKVFSLMTDRFKYEPNTCLTKILDEINDGTLGDMKCNKWLINQAVSEIYIEFPEKAKELSEVYDLEDTFVPGIYLAKSDIGECAVTVKATWRHGNSILVEYELRRKNTKNLDIDKIIEDIKNKVFENYTKLPEVLCDLMMIDVTDPSLSASGASAEDIQAANRESVEDVLNYVFKSVNIADAIGKKRTKKILSDLLDSLDYSMDYTAYDIAMLVMTIPESVSGIPRMSEMALQEACGKAPYVDYGEATKSVVTVA